MYNVFAIPGAGIDSSQARRQHYVTVLSMLWLSHQLIEGAGAIPVAIFTSSTALPIVHLPTSWFHRPRLVLCHDLLCLRWKRPPNPNIFFGTCGYLTPFRVVTIPVKID